MSKGSRQRTLNSDKFNANYDRIFGVKNDRDNRVPRHEEEECSKNNDRPKKEESI